MPIPGSQPIPGQDKLDLGNGLAATRYTDGSVVVWRITPPNEEVAYIEPGKQVPSSLGDGRAAYARPDGGIDVFDIANPPAAYRGTALGPGQTAGNLYSTDPNSEAPAALQALQAPSVSTPGVNPPSVNNPITPGGYGSKGFLPSGEPRPLDPLVGTTDFGRGPNVNILPEYLAPLNDPKISPGYIPGSGTYNQFRLDQGDDPKEPRLFGTMAGTPNVNLRYGMGGPGDPSNGSELQTPTKFASNSTGGMGDAKWQATGGTWRGGGGWDQAWAGAVPGYRPGPGVSAPGGGLNAAGYGASGWQYPYPGNQQAAGGGYDRGYAGDTDYSGGGGMGGGAFEWSGNLTGQWAPLATMIGRSDSPPYGIATNAVSYPQAYYDLLRQAIQGGVVKVNPVGWQFLAETKNITPASWGINAAAVAGSDPNQGPAGSSGGSGSLAGASANAAAAAAADRAAYWAYQQALLHQGDQRLAIEAAQQAWTKEYQTALLTGELNGTETEANRQAVAGITGFYNGAPTMAREQQTFQQQMQQVANDLAAAGLLGTYQGQQTLAAKAQEFSQQFQQTTHQDQTALALMGLQAQLQGPRNWANYQSTFSSTPQGLQDVMAAFSGRYQLPTGSGAASSAQGGQQSVAGLSGDILSGTYGQGNGAALGNPRQADLQNWARMQPSQREMVLGKYENQGWYGPDVENLIKGAAPKYSGPQTGSYNFFQA